MSSFNVEKQCIFDRVQSIIFADETQKRMLQVSSQTNPNDWLNGRTVMRVMKDAFVNKYAGLEPQQCVQMSDNVAADGRQQIIPLHALGWKGALLDPKTAEFRQYRQRDHSTEFLGVAIEDMGQRRMDAMMADQALPAISPMVSTSVVKGSPLIAESDGVFVNSSFMRAHVLLHQEMEHFAATIPGIRQIDEHHHVLEEKRATIGTNLPTAADAEDCLRTVGFDMKHTSSKLYDLPGMFYTYEFARFFSHEYADFETQALKKFPGFFPGPVTFRNSIPHLITRFCDTTEDMRAQRILSIPRHGDAADSDKKRSNKLFDRAAFVRSLIDTKYETGMLETKLVGDMNASESSKNLLRVLNASGTNMYAGLRRWVAERREVADCAYVDEWAPYLWPVPKGACDGTCHESEINKLKHLLMPASDTADDSDSGDGDSDRELM
jgi:hypothetical protein